MVLALPRSFPAYEAGQLARQVALEPVQRTRRTCRGHDVIVLPGHVSGRPARRSRCPTRDVATQLVLLTTTQACSRPFNKLSCQLGAAVRYRSAHEGRAGAARGSLGA